MTASRFGIFGAAASRAAVERAVAGRRDAVTSAFGDHIETSWENLISRNDLDAVLITDHTASNPAMIAQALDCGLHVWVRGRGGETIEDIIAIRRAEAVARGQILKFSAEHRQHTSVREAKRIASDGDLGQLLFMRGVYGDSSIADEGALTRLGLPMLDLMQMFAGPVEDTKSLIEVSHTRRHPHDANAVAVFRTHAGTLATLHVSATQWRRTFRLELGFSNGYIWLDGLNGSSIAMAPEMLITARIDNSAHASTEPQEHIQEFPAQDTLSADLVEFIEAIRSGAPLRTGTTTQLFDAMNAVQRIYADDHSFDLVSDDPVEA